VSNSHTMTRSTVPGRTFLLLSGATIVTRLTRPSVAGLSLPASSNPDASGEWVLQPAKTGKTLQRRRGSIVGVLSRREQ
jgi:hypothetical protein